MSKAQVQVLNKIKSSLFSFNAVILPITSFTTDIYIYVDSNSLVHSAYWLSRDSLEAIEYNINTQESPTFCDATSEKQNFFDQSDQSNCLSVGEARNWTKYQRDSKLHEFKHSLSAVFQPCLIIGCILSVGLTIFIRIVILGCGHRNFRSAMMSVFFYSLIPMLTTVVVLQNASFLIGRNGLTCVSCVLEKLNNTPCWDHRDEKWW